MDWFWPPMAYMAYLTGSFDTTVWPITEPEVHQRPVAAAERSLIEVVYGVIAAETSCARCGAPLGPPRVRKRAWPLRVTARCSGPRRHRHRADVLRTSEGLRTGPLTITRPAREHP
ncbi:hypothetical protein EDD29_5404 [Actinocorallia herbida]|uniref:Uncharacterized protein n=1 Tax=Actinocorallia herbida TaxID=58109 RepID=A0A3N1D3X2_9ACTN|nr:hypothetical protein [Actinocorallia herbida]ROO87768.1 hypothetical protein EDD29_5404 [Actinocorallia herbida]